MPDLKLRPIESEDDVAAIATFLADPSLVGRRGLRDDRPVPRSMASLIRAIEGMAEKELGETWVVDSGGVVGMVNADWWWDAMSPWVHVVIDPQHQRHGHGTMAIRLVLDHLFLNTPAHIVQGGVPGWDDEGLAFAESLGAVEMGRMRRVGVREGAYFDEVDFVITRDMWEEEHASRR